ncbi:MAG: DUF559 domain-containing protein [Myxococcales bacterium]|nr:DUF559 domain-containing protein [Myxococcales bacterium]
MKLRRQQHLAARAAGMRAAPTESEAALRFARVGLASRCGAIIADFVAPSRWLIIEVDGGAHPERGAADARRDRKLAKRGYLGSGPCRACAGGSGRAGAGTPAPASGAYASPSRRGSGSRVCGPINSPSFARSLCSG